MTEYCYYMTMSGMEALPTTVFNTRYTTTSLTKVLIHWIQVPDDIENKLKYCKQFVELNKSLTSGEG